jgi:hypothetical protein
MRIWQGWLGLMTIVCAIAGCDKSAPPPPPQASNTPPPAATEEPTSAPAPAPTTQELLTGKYKTIALPPTPLTVEAPESWQYKIIDIKDSPEVRLLTGPAPDGSTARIAPLRGSSVPLKTLEFILNGAKRASTREANVTCTIRDAGDMKVMEVLKIPDFSPTSETYVDWKLTCFIRGDLDYSSYTLDVIGLTPAQLEKSKDLYKKIFDSVAYKAPANPL